MIVALAVVLVVLTAVAGVGPLGHLFRGTGGAAAPDPGTALPRVQAYVTALHEQDKAAIERLAPPGYVGVDADIDARLRTYGGVRSDSTTVDLVRDIATDAVTAHIHTVDASGHPIQWDETWCWRDQTWWLLVGHSSTSDAIPGSSA